MKKKPSIVKGPPWRVTVDVRASHGEVAAGAVAEALYRAKLDFVFVGAERPPRHGVAVEISPETHAAIVRVANLSGWTIDRQTRAILEEWARQTP